MKSGAVRGRVLQVLKPKGMESPLGLLGEELQDHGGMEAVRCLDCAYASEKLQVGDEASDAAAAGDLDGRLPVEIADDEQDRKFASLRHVREDGDQAPVLDARLQVTRIEEMNQSVLADIDVAVGCLLDDPGVLQPQKALAEILVKSGRDGDNGRGEAVCLLLERFHGLSAERKCERAEEGNGMQQSASLALVGRGSLFKEELPDAPQKLKLQLTVARAQRAVYGRGDQ